MSTLAALIYTGTLNGKPLRFFKAPFVDPHLPWHSYDDLLRCIGVKQWIRDDTLRILRSWLPNDICSVPCSSEIVLITPHYAARWFIKNLRGTIKSRASHDLKYRTAMIDAWYASMSNTSPREAEILFLEAFKNTDRAEAGWAA